MLEVEVKLDFSCCICGSYMGVTLKCEGKGLIAGRDALASVKVPCPTCGDNNTIFFTPSGTLQDVIPDEKAFAAPVPSYN